MAHASKKKVSRMARRGKDTFAQDEIDGEYENPGPRIDQEAAAIAAMLSEIRQRPGPTAWVEKWSPKWLRSANQKAHQAAIKALAEARKELAEAASAEQGKGETAAQAVERATRQANMRINMASETLRTTEMALRQSPDAASFGLYYFQDKLAVDRFDRAQNGDEELDALEFGLKPLQQIEVGLKTALCAKHGILYLAIGPDDDLPDKVKLAARLGLTKARPVARKANGGTGDGITEEESV